MDRYGMRKVLTLFKMISLLLFTSCAKDAVGSDPAVSGGNTVNGGNIDFRINIAPQTRVNTDLEFKSYWDDGDEIGVFAVSRVAGETASLAASGNYIHNVKISYSSSGGGTWTVSEDLYFPGRDKVLDFYAYYPYDDNGGNPAAVNPLNLVFNVKPDQSADTGGKSNYDLSEVMAAKTMEVNNGTVVDFLFSHSLTMMQVKVSGKDFNDFPPQVEIRKVRTASKLNFNTAGNPAASATTGDTETVTMRPVEKKLQETHNDTITYRALVPVQTFEKGRPVFHILYRDKAFTSPILASELLLPAGTAHIYRQGSVSGIFTADDLVRFSTDWNAVTTVAAHNKVISEWSDTGDENGMVRVWADIDMKDKVFVPIGLGGNFFTGKFDGGGFVINNLKIDRGPYPYAGLFGRVDNGEIRNVVLDKCDISGYSHIGGIVGLNNESVVSNCHVKNSTVTAQAFYSGGVVGRNSGAVTSYCGVENIIVRSGGFSGGIAGLNENISSVTANIQGCFVNGGDITVSSTYCGGITGRNTGSNIVGCSVSGTAVEATVSGAGGIAGNNYSGGSIAGCLVAGATINAETSDCGGITGNNEFDCLVIGCIASPDKVCLESDNSKAGIIVGSYDSASVIACYWGKLTGFYAVGGNPYLLPDNGFDRNGVGNFFTTDDGANTPVGYMNNAISAYGYEWYQSGEGKYPSIRKKPSYK